MSSDIDHWQINATVFKDRVEEIHIVSDPSRNVRRRPQTKVWQVERFLGRGGFGEVRLERNTLDGQARAVKRIPTTSTSLSNSECVKELKALLEFSKPKSREAAVFVDFFGWFKDGSDMFLAMEYVQLGDLEKNVSGNPGRIPATEARDIAEQILSGLAIMHAESFAHRDLKPQNVLVVHGPPQWWVKLADFGLSKRLTDTTAFYTRGGTQSYMAPETLNFLGTSDSEITNAVDIWAAGCIIYRLIAGVVPFPPGLALMKYCEDKSKFPPNTLFESEAKSEGSSFIRGLLTAHPKERPSAAEALRHEWLVSAHDANIKAAVVPEYTTPSTGHLLESSERTMSDMTYNTVSHGGLKSYQTSLHPDHSHNCSNLMSGSGSTTVTSSSQSFIVKRKALPSLATQESSHNLSEKATSLTIKPQKTSAGGESGTTRSDTPKLSLHERHRSTSGQQNNQPEDLVLHEVNDEEGKTLTPVSSDSRSPVKTDAVASTATTVSTERNLAVADLSPHKKAPQNITATSDRPLEERAVDANRGRTGQSSPTSQGPDGSLTQKLVDTAASPSADRSHMSAFASADNKGSWSSILAKEITVRQQIGEGVGSVRLNGLGNAINQWPMPNATGGNSSPSDLIDIGYENETGPFTGVPPDLLQDHSQIPAAASRELIIPSAAAPLRIISYAKAIQNFHGTGAPDELIFLKDAIIEVLGPVNQEWGPARKDWWQGKIGDRIGVFPMSHVEFAVSSMQAQSQSPITRVRALYDFVPTEDDELAFTRGDVLLITDVMHGSWWMAATEFRTGMIPINYVEVLPVPTSADLFLGRVTHVRALFHFSPTERGQLAFKIGNLIRLISTRFDGWWLGELHGKEGIFPLSHVEIVPNDSTSTGQYLVDTVTGSTAFVQASRLGHEPAENDADDYIKMLRRRRMLEQTARLFATSTEAEGPNLILDPSVDVKAQVQGGGDHKVTLRPLTEQEAAAKIAQQPRRQGSLSSPSDVDTSTSGLKKRLTVEDLSKYSPLQSTQPVIAKTKLKVDIHGAIMKIAAKGKPEDNFLSCQILLDGIVVYRTKGVTSPTCDPVWNESFSVTINLHFIRNAKLICLLICDCFRHDSLGENLGEATLDFGSINTYGPVDITTPLKYTSGSKTSETGSIIATMRFIEPSQHANKADTPREYLPFNPVTIPDVSSEPKDRVKFSGDGSTPSASSPSSILAMPEGLVDHDVYEGHYQSYRPASKKKSPARINKPNDNKSVGRKCAVCEQSLQDVLRGEQKFRLSCGHDFHESCLNENIEAFGSQGCPACNVSLGLDAGGKPAKFPYSQDLTSPSVNNPYPKTAADGTPYFRNFEQLDSSGSKASSKKPSKASGLWSKLARDINRSKRDTS